MGQKPNSARVAARRDEIFRKAAEAFRELGYNNTTIEAIAAKLNVTKASIYYYVNGKQDLLFEAHRFAMEILLTGLREIATRQSPPKLKLEQAIRHHIVSVIDELSLTTQLLQQEYALSKGQREHIVQMRDEYERLFRGIIAEGIAAGVFRSTNPKMAAFVILGALNWMPHWFSQSGPLGKDEIAGVVSDHLLGGLLRSDTASPAGAGAGADWFGIAGRVIVVTGAATGPGRAVSWALARSGARVVLVDRDAESLDEIATAIRDHGSASASFVAQVGRGNDVRSFIDATLKQFGRIDGLVYATGIADAKSLLEAQESEWNQLIETNLTGAFLVTRAVCHVMSPNRDGSIVLLSSAPIASARSMGISGAIASIGALEGLTKTLATEMAPCRVRVNALLSGIAQAPTLNSTGGEAHGNGRLLDPEAHTGTMLFLLSPASFHVTGQTLRVDDLL